MVAPPDGPEPDDVVILLRRTADGPLFVVARASDPQIRYDTNVDAERHARLTAAQLGVNLWYARDGQPSELVAKYRPSQRA